jgi:hypothetical protein
MKTNMKLIGTLKTPYVILLLAVFLFMPTVVFGETNEFTLPISVTEKNITIDESFKTINGSLILKNISEQDIPDVGWYIVLKEQEKKEVNGETELRQSVVEYFLLNKEEFFYLNKDEEKNVDFSLKYSSDLKAGNYLLKFQAISKVRKNKGTFIKRIKLTNEAKGFLQFDQCKISREGATFDPEEGPNVNPESMIKFSCNLIGDLEKAPKIVYPELTIAELNVFDFPNRTYFKKEILQPIDLSKDKGKFSFEIRTAKDPRVYQGALRMMNENKTPITTYQTLRYVVRGEGARIADVTLDKNYYAKGDKAQISFKYYVSSDLNWQSDEEKPEPGSPLNALAKFSLISEKDGAKTICGEAQKEISGVNDEGALDLSLEISVKNDCFNPKLVTNIEKNGNILSGYDVALKSSSQPEKAENKSSKALLFLAIILLLIILALIVRKKTKIKPNPLTLVVFFVASLAVIFGIFLWNGSQIAKANKVYDSNKVIHVHQKANPPEIDYKVSITNLSQDNPVGDINVSSSNPYNSSDTNKAFTISYDTLDKSCDNTNSTEWLRIGYFIKDKDGNIVKDRKIFETMNINTSKSGGEAGTSRDIYPVELYGGDGITFMDISKAPYKIYFDFRLAMFGNLSSGYRVYPASTTDKDGAGTSGFYFLNSDATFDAGEKTKAFENAYDLTESDFNNVSGDNQSPNVRSTTGTGLRNVKPLTRSWTINETATLSVTSPGSKGRITTTNIDCGNGGVDCSETVTNMSSSYYLTATPAAGYSFNSSTGWTGCNVIDADGWCYVSLNQDKTISATFTANPAPVAVNGVCGSADGINSYTAPATNLCNAGTATAVTTNPGSWTWTCNGSGGGINDTCSAPKKIDGTCGTANRTYANGEPFKGPSYEYCGAGDGVVVAPAPLGVIEGSTKTWNCKGSNGGVNSPTCSATRGPKPTLSFSASPDIITAGPGKTTTLTWSTGNGVTSCNAQSDPLNTGWNGGKATSNAGSKTQNVTLSQTPGTYNFKLECWNDTSGTTGQISIPVKVVAAPTLTFTASPTSITAGNSSTLSWTTTSATSCWASGAWTGSKSASGSEIVYPPATSTYFFECWNDAGTSTGIKFATVIVTAAPVNGVCGSADKKIYSAYDTGWGADTFCSAGTTVPAAITFPGRGVSKYWDCNGLNGGTNISCSASREKLVDLVFSGSTPVVYESSSVLTWAPSANVTSCYGESDDGVWNGWKSNTGGTDTTVPLIADRTYSMQCWNIAGDASPKKSAVIKIAPSLELSINPLNIINGDPANINWTVKGADINSCWPQSTPIDPNWSGVNQDSSDESHGKTIYPTGVPSSDYTLECWRNGITSGQKTASVAVSAVSPTSVVGTCGSAAREYAIGEDFIGSSYNYCGVGDGPDSTPSLGASGGSTATWNCKGSNGGAPSPACTATRAAAVHFWNKWVETKP